MKGILRGAILLFAVLTSSALFAQEITGNYNLSVSQNPGFEDCVWSGDLGITQSGGNPGTFTGIADVNVVSGPCPDLAGVANGTINGSTLEFGVAAGALGSVQFDGSVDGSNNLSGTWALSSPVRNGTWSAVLAPVEPQAAAVPTLPEWALIMLSIFVAGFGLYFGRTKVV